MKRLIEASGSAQCLNFPDDSSLTARFYDYWRVETSLISYTLSVMDALKVQNLKLGGMELRPHCPDFPCEWREGRIIDVQHFDHLFRMCIRGNLWFRMHHEEDFFVSFYGMIARIGINTTLELDHTIFRTFDSILIDDISCCLSDEAQYYWGEYKPISWD